MNAGLGHTINGAINEPLHRLFEAQTRATPAAEALVWDDLRLRYEQLDRRANRLAN